VGAGRGSPAAEGGSHVRVESEVGEGGHHIVARASRQASEASKRGRPSRHPVASSTESETHKQKRHFSGN
jgi:hypothetical protein